VPCTGRDEQPAESPSLECVRINGGGFYFGLRHESRIVQPVRNRSSNLMMPFIPRRLTRVRMLLRLGIVVCLLRWQPAVATDLAWESYPAFYELDEWSLDWSPVHGLRVDAHRIVHVSRSSGTEIGNIRIWDTFFQRLKSFEGVVRDTLGRELYRVGLDDVRSLSPFSEFRLYSGDVIRAVDLVAPQPPYVIEASWSIEIDNPFFWPDWILADRYPRKRAVYRVALAPRNEIRYRQVYPSLAQTEEESTRRRTLTWELRDWTPDEPWPEENHFSIPLLYVAPREFRVGRREGDTDSWESLGQWYWSLTADRLGLKRDQVRTMAKEIEDVVGVRAQAAALKDWVSDDWRYVAIEVGLGGWQPRPAKEVFDHRYGDCKDVVFLWVSMMRERGIEAYPALIRARNPLPIDPSFPKDWFDHVAAMAIIDGDTLWADPSDRRYRLGTLPRSCESRWALVVGEFGGQLVCTPCRTAPENRQTVRCEGRLDAEGNLDFEARVSASGHYAQLLPVDGGMDPSTAAAAVLGIAPPALEGMLENVRVVSSDELALQVHGRIKGWAVSEPKRMVIRPRLAGWMAVDTLGGRAAPGHVDFPQIVYDTLVIEFPKGWAPELWPTAEFQSETTGEFGEVRTFEDNRLTIVRHLRWEQCDRSEPGQHRAARLRACYRAAENAEWIFRDITNLDNSGSRDSVSPTLNSVMHDGRTPKDSALTSGEGGP